MKKQDQDAEPGRRPPPPSLTQGDFRSNGSWNPAVPGSSRGPRYRFVQSLVRARRAARISPAQLAEQIEASDHVGMFPELGQWKSLLTWTSWPFAYTRTAAEECVKRAGYGTSDDPHWEDGAFVQGDDERNLPQVPIEQVRTFVDGLTNAILTEKDASKRVSDQEFFEGKTTA